MDKISTIMARLTFGSLAIVSLFIFVSFSATAAHHGLLILPGLYFTYQFIKRKELNFSFSSWALVLLVLWVILSVLFNWGEYEKPLGALFKVKYLLIGVLSIPAFSALFRMGISKKRVRLLLNTFLISTSVATLSGLLAIYTGFNLLKFKPACHPFRACGLYGMTITYGYGISLFVLLLVGLLYFRKELKGFFNEKILYLALVINIAGLLLSYARGGVIAFVCGCATLIWFKSRKLFTIVTTVIVVGLSLIAYLTSIQKFESRYLMPLKQRTNMIRVGQYQGAWYAFTESPVFGKGFRNFEPQSAEIKSRHGVEHYPEWVGHAHNNFLEFLAGCGLIAFLAALCWHFGWLKASLFSKDPRLQLFAPFIVGMIVSGLFQSTIIDGENMFLIMPAFGLFEAIRGYGEIKGDLE